MRQEQLAGIDKYRYGYQGDFAEDETEETGWNSFELRLYDGVIGKWLSVDPYGQHWSPYLGMGNNPVNRIDPDGGKDGPGNPIGVVGDGPCKCSTVDEDGNHVTYFIDELYDWPDIMSLDYWLHDEYFRGDVWRIYNKAVDAEDWWRVRIWNAEDMNMPLGWSPKVTAGRNEKVNEVYDPTGGEHFYASAKIVIDAITWAKVNLLYDGVQEFADDSKWVENEYYHYKGQTVYSSVGSSLKWATHSRERNPITGYRSVVYLGYSKLTQTVK